MRTVKLKVPRLGAPRAGSLTRQRPGDHAAPALDQLGPVLVRHARIVLSHHVRSMSTPSPHAGRHARLGTSAECSGFNNSAAALQGRRGTGIAICLLLFRHRRRRPPSGPMRCRWRNDRKQMAMPVPRRHDRATGRAAAEFWRPRRSALHSWRAWRPACGDGVDAIKRAWKSRDSFDPRMSDEHRAELIKGWRGVIARTLTLNDPLSSAPSRRTSFYRSHRCHSSSRAYPGNLGVLDHGAGSRLRPQPPAERPRLLR